MKKFKKLKITLFMEKRLYRVSHNDLCSIKCDLSLSVIYPDIMFEAIS